MLVATVTVCSLLLAGSAPAPAPAPDEPEVATLLAEVRRYYVPGEPSWTLRLRRDLLGQVSASLWWTEGEPVHSGLPPEVVRGATRPGGELPDLIRARTARLAQTDCAALPVLASRLERLDMPDPPVGSVDPTADGAAAVVFRLERPGHPPVELARLSERHPLVRWVNEAWNELAVCAGVGANGSDRLGD